MRVNDRSSHGANGNALTHGLPAHEVVGFFFVQIALFHEDTFCALNAAKGPQGFCRFAFAAAARTETAPAQRRD
jgi:hypothetical protein